jgi:uncharacterized protein with FMN-binding domain
MKKWILVGATVLVFTAFAVYQHIQGNKPTLISSSASDTGASTISINPAANGTVPLVASSGSTSTSTTTSTTPASTPTPTPTPTPAPQTGKYKNGTYTGPVVDAFYGNVQVSATISGGQLASVSFLQYPSDRGTSQRISAQAMPILQSEAIQAQSANVDVVSGATQISQGFISSLAQALRGALN